MHPRVRSILDAALLTKEVTGWPAFDISSLEIDMDCLTLDLPDNLRLGHLVEHVVSALIHASSNYALLHEGVQVADNGVTIGELDYLLEEVETHRELHLELAYKFYLYDPQLGPSEVHRWIGPNRNDSLLVKLEKLRKKQFPLLYHPLVSQQLPDVEIGAMDQRLCLLASLYVPVGTLQHHRGLYYSAIKGEYMTLDHFKGLDHSYAYYAVPDKRHWGISPEDNSHWLHYGAVLPVIESSILQRRCTLCWVLREEKYQSIFITWW